MSDRPEKPLGIRAYGSIPHLPGSRRGPADKGLSDQQSRILTEKARDKHDYIVVQEKLDGSCVSVANIKGSIVPLIRAGYNAHTSNYRQHRVFANWVDDNAFRFADLLKDGERCVGEWLWEAHGTIYDLPHEPFVLFDIMVGHERATYDTLIDRCEDFVLPRLLHYGDPISVEFILQTLEPSAHGVIGEVEGAVWRCERKGVVDFLGKYVRPTKVDGKYLESITGEASVVNKINGVPLDEYYRSIVPAPQEKETL